MLEVNFPFAMMVIGVVWAWPVHRAILVWDKFVDLETLKVQHGDTEQRPVMVKSS